MKINVIGGGLAGAEAALRIANAWLTYKVYPLPKYL